MNLTEENDVLDFEKMSKEEFMEKQRFNDQQKALFYLGDMLSKIAYMQHKSGYPKPVLNKLCYQGISLNDIKRLFKISLTN